jgi:hypothetical protein
MATPPAGSATTLGARIANLEDLLRSYAAGDLVPGVAVTLKIDIADGATADVDTAALPFGIEIDEVMVVNVGANGANANSFQIKNGAGTAISDAISTNGKASGDIVRAANIAPATRQINAGGVVRVTRTRAGGVAQARILAYCTFTGL